MALGLYAGLSDGPLDDAWGDAIASDAEEGAEIAFRLNAERMDARAARRQGGGPSPGD